MTTQSVANHPHKLLQEKKLPGIGAFYPSMLDPSLCRYPDHILWALTDDGSLITVDEYIDASQEHNEDNYYSLGLGKYVGAQHEIHKTLDSDLNIFLSDNPQYKSRIFPEQINP